MALYAGKVSFSALRGEKRSFEREESVGCCDACAVMMKATPCAAFEVVETKLAFHLLVVALDAPTQFCQVDELFARSLRR